MYWYIVSSSTTVTSLMIWILNLHMNTMLFCQLLWTQECVLVKSRGNLLKEEKNIKWSISKPNAFKSWQIFQKNFVGTQKQLHKFKQHVTIIYLQTIKKKIISDNKSCGFIKIIQETMLMIFKIMGQKNNFLNTYPPPKINKLRLFSFLYTFIMPHTQS